MRMNQRRAASPSKLQIGPRIACEHCQRCEGASTSCRVLERQGACPSGGGAETFPAHVKRAVSAQMLCLLAMKGSEILNRFVAKNRHFRQGVSGSDGWNLHTIRPRPVTLVWIGAMHDYKSLSAGEISHRWRSC